MINDRAAGDGARDPAARRTPMVLTVGVFSCGVLTGQNSAAMLDSVCAAIRRIAYLTLTAEWKMLRNSAAT